MLNFETILRTVASTADNRVSRYSLRGCTAAHLKADGLERGPADVLLGAELGKAADRPKGEKSDNVRHSSLFKNTCT